MNAQTFTIRDGWNDLKHQVEQQRLCDLLEEGFEIVSTGTLPDRIVYVLIETQPKQVLEDVMVDGRKLKPGVLRSKRGTYYIKGKGFIKNVDAYE